MKAWTDYPFIELGDAASKSAPVREIQVISYDGDKYCRVQVEGLEHEIKSGYVYTKAGVYGQVPKITRRQLAMLPRTDYSTSEPGEKPK